MACHGEMRGRDYPPTRAAARPLALERGLDGVWRPTTWRNTLRFIVKTLYDRNSPGRTAQHLPAMARLVGGFIWTLNRLLGISTGCHLIGEADLGRTSRP